MPVTWPSFTATNEVLGLDIASDGGLQAFTTLSAAHQCDTVWSTITF